MSKKTFSFSLLVIIALLFAINSHSQVVIVNLSQPSPNQWNVADMWNLTLTNTSSKAIKVYLHGTVEAQSDGLIFEGTSAVFNFPANYSGRIDPRQLEPADVGYANSDYEEIVLRTGTMPEGIYTICITVKDAETDEELGRGCVVQPITSISPPELLNPVDEAELTEPLPVFTWLPPTPLSGNYSVSYLIRIVELLDGQAPLEAMDANPAWFTERNIPSTSFQLPVSARSIEPGKSYAWQVTAYGNKYEIGKSEVWSFNINTSYQIKVDSLIIVGYAWDLDTDGKIEIKPEECDDGNNDGNNDDLDDWDVNPFEEYEKYWWWHFFEDYLYGSVAYEWDFDIDGKVRVGCVGKVTVNHRGIHWALDKDATMALLLEELCDDGLLPEEECDDGGFGDEPGEVCDDGNTTEGDGCDDMNYHFVLFVTNVNPGDANLSITGITKTTPRSTRKPIIVPDEIEPVMIKSGEQGVITGTINTGKTKAKDICIGIKLEDQLNPKENSILDEACGRILGIEIPFPNSRRYDFGDAPDPDFPSYDVNDGAKHLWKNILWLIHANHRAWLGKMTPYIGNNPDCSQLQCSLSVDYENDSKQIDLDNPYDDGVHFFNPPSNYCTECELDSIDVTFSIDPEYSKTNPLLFHAWFDFNRDGDWDDDGYCGNPTRTNYVSEHIIWKAVKRLCPGASPYGTIVANQEFRIDPGTWGGDCATYRLYFKAGLTSTSQQVTDKIWTRFRLTPMVDLPPNSPNPDIAYENADEYKFMVVGGEVEDYPITCSSPASGYDFGDAPDELDSPGNTHYCTHRINNIPANCFQPNPRVSPSPWTSRDAAFHETFTKEWLGEIKTGSDCSPISANAECNGKTINQDQLDDGVEFSGLFHYPFQACDVQKVQVLINTANPADYDESHQLHLHAWFDWNQDGDWDDYSNCEYPADDHVYWLTAKPTSPPGPVITVNSYDFAVNPQNPAIWPDPQSRCQRYEFTFLSGQPLSDSIATDTLWSRFRLFHGSDNTIGNYFGGTKRGEVEDYPIVPGPCDSADYGDAPDELDNPLFHFSTHENNPGFPPAKHYDISKFWLGDLDYGCECYGPSADKECDGKTIDNDNFDNGINFDDFQCNYEVCGKETVIVKISTLNPNTAGPLYLHAWIDWNQDGDWDDVYEDCGGQKEAKDHLFWLYAEPLCAPYSPGTIINIYSHEFKIDPQYLNNTYQEECCQRFKLTFLSGNPPEPGTGVGTIWSRFRLSGQSGIADQYFGDVPEGEVEDYEITCE